MRIQSPADHDRLLAAAILAFATKPVAMSKALTFPANQARMDAFLMGMQLER